MKKVKADRCICLLTVVVCLMLIFTSLTVFAAHTDGSTEVVARIETVPTDYTQPATDNADILVPDDDTNIPTGNIISALTIIALIVLIFSVLAVYLLK